MLLVYDNPANWANVTEEQMQGLYKEYGAVGQNPATVDSAQLKPVETAKTVRIKGGETLVTDGRVRRDEGAARRLLRRRDRLDRRGGEDRRADPFGPHGRLGRGARARGDVAMQYMFLLYSEEGAWESRSEDERRTLYAEYAQLNGDLHTQGKLISGDELQPVATATTVQVRKGETLVSDGPFAETKEALGGYYLIEADSQDLVLELCRLLADVVRRRLAL